MNEWSPITGKERGDSPVETVLACKHEELGLSLEPQNQFLEVDLAIYVFKIPERDRQVHTWTSLASQPSRLSEFQARDSA